MLSTYLDQIKDLNVALCRISFLKNIIIKLATARDNDKPLGAPSNCLNIFQSYRK